MQSPDWIIREALSDDIPALARLSRLTFLDTYQEINQKDQENMEAYMDQAFSPAHLSQLMEDPKVTFLVLEKEQKLIAYVKLVRDYASEGWDFPAGAKVMNLEKIYVLKDHTGQRLGSALMHHVLEMAQAEKIDVIWLGVWNVNRKAMQFYERFGFELAGIHPFLMGKNVYEDLLMQKYL